MLYFFYVLSPTKMKILGEYHDSSNPFLVSFGTLKKQINPHYKITKAKG